MGDMDMSGTIGKISTAHYEVWYQIVKDNYYLLFSRKFIILLY